MYKVEATRAFQKDIERLGRKVISLIFKKIEWLAEHPEMARHPLHHLPTDLSGLHKYRIGDYRIFFWINHNAKTITLYRVIHRREAYRNF